MPLASVQVHVITGGASGIGFTAAKALAACRWRRGTTGNFAGAEANISKATGNTKVSLLVSALLTIAVQSDALQCNAGVENSPDFLPLDANDGFASIWQVNGLSHLLLVGRVFPLLYHSGGRVAITASRMPSNACKWSEYLSCCVACCERATGPVLTCGWFKHWEVMPVSVFEFESQWLEGLCLSSSFSHYRARVYRALVVVFF